MHDIVLRQPADGQRVAGRPPSGASACAPRPRPRPRHPGLLAAAAAALEASCWRGLGCGLRTWHTPPAPGGRYTDRRSAAAGSTSEAASTGVTASSGRRYLNTCLAAKNAVWSRATLTRPSGPSPTSDPERWKYQYEHIRPGGCSRWGSNCL